MSISTAVAVYRRLALCLLPFALGTAAAVVLLFVAGGPARPALANTLNYPGCAATIQDCIDNANPGDTLLISPGDYTESLTLSKAVSLTGALSSTTVLHALPNTRVLTATGAAVDSSVVISGLTFTGGYLSSTLGCPTSCSGGGILFADQSRPRLINSIVATNTAGGGLSAGSGAILKGVRIANNTGGGAFVVSAATVEDSVFVGNQNPTASGGGLNIIFGALALTNTQFINNVAGGVGGGVASAPSDAVTVQGGVFQGNSCSNCAGGGLYAAGELIVSGTRFLTNTSDTSGGAVYLDHGVLRGVLFQGNQCTRPVCQGGAVYASANSAPFNLALTDTQFVGNSAAVSGGALNASGPTTIEGGLFSGNLVTESIGNGGGVRAWNTIALTGTIFLGNHSSGNGGALALGGAGSARVVNVLMAGNSAGGLGSALVQYRSGATTILHTTFANPAPILGAAIVVTDGVVGITNTIVSNFAAGISQVGGSVFQDYNLFFGNTADTVGPVGGGAHNRSGDPLFINPAGGDYHIATTSPAVDGGVDAAVSTDFDGQPRPEGLGFDIGYDEAQTIPPDQLVFMPFVARQ